METVNAFVVAGAIALSLTACSAAWNDPRNLQCQREAPAASTLPWRLLRRLWMRSNHSGTDDIFLIPSRGLSAA